MTLDPVAFNDALRFFLFSLVALALMLAIIKTPSHCFDPIAHFLNGLISKMNKPRGKAQKIIHAK